MRVVLSPRALDDLSDIADFIARDDAARARSFVEELREACRDLGTFPRRYASFPRLGPNAHRRTHGNYVILYDVEVEVNVVAVVHGARDIDAIDFLIIGTTLAPID